MAATKANCPTVNDELDNFDVDDFADPFADSGDENSKGKADTQSKKRKDASGLGIEEEVNVAKKQRVPNVKLDTPRLLSDKGIPKLRRKARELKFKGKGHEFSDTARLLSFYQLWLDDLFPKAKFLDALAMIEKTGHTKHMQMERLAWINEGKPKPSRDDDDEDEVPEIITDILGRDATVLPARIAPIFQNGRSSERPQTPAVGDDLFGDEDIYDATPRGSKKTTALAANAAGGEPDEEDLDALMAEEEAQRGAPSTSLFGNGGSLFGSGKPAAANKPPTARPAEPDDEDDLDALMAEAEAESSSKPSQPAAAAQNAPKPTAADEEDDLDALMAEAEAAEFRAPPKSQPPPAQADRNADVDEEEAMAEMDGLW
ncbi:chromosome segregation in meiosis protein 3 [Apiospora phragmitis]|uniref:Chromosome segregation in meiosis protein n=1 Tax=Apiospora phragmitis TaxID=2905665 RepID=A0ABR1VS73_9PEZI